MFKNIKVSNLVFEMLVEVARQRKPQINPEQFLEKLIKLVMFRLNWKINIALKKS